MQGGLPAAWWWMLGINIWLMDWLDALSVSIHCSMHISHNRSTSDISMPDIVYCAPKPKLTTPADTGT